MEDVVTELAEQLVEHPNWSWREGMRDQAGVRIVDLELWNADGALPDLEDWATAGAMLGVLAETGLLTDMVLQEGEWIVAVEMPDGLQGWAADTFGAAVGYALLAAWGVITAPGAGPSA